MKFRSAVLAWLFPIALCTPVLAHDKAPHGRKAEKAAISTEEKAFGREGDPGKVARTIKVDMSDKMRFSPGEL
jgi:hypothetical protein